MFFLSTLPSQTFSSCFEASLMDARWLLQSQASHLHEVPKPEEVVFKNRKTSLNLADLPADLFLKQLQAKGIDLSYESGAD